MSCPFHSQHFLDQRFGLETLLPYQYERLTTPTDIRLFTLYGSSSNAPIEGSVATVSDISTRPYLALSYTWGSSPPFHPIRCDGKKLYVNCNLFSALHRLRRNSEETVWFVDFICINQSREKEWLQERSDQVRRMAFIYRSASQVIVDLGQAPAGMDGVFALMKHCCGFSEQDILRKSGQLDQLFSPPFTTNTWDTFASICERPWFQRIWVLQEYALATSVLFLIGTEQYPDSIVMQSIQLAFQITGVSAKYPKEMAVVRYRLRPANTLIYAMDRLSRRLEDKSRTVSPRSLIAALKIAQSFQATDRRDRIYGLLGLIHDSDISDFQIDYAESIAALSRRVTLLLLRQGGVIDLLHTLACLHPEHHVSWMIDLDMYRRPEGIDRLFLEPGHEEWYSAGGNQPIQFHVQNEKCLIVKGIYVDKIRSISAPFPDEPDSDPDLLATFTHEMTEWDSSTIQWAFDALVDHRDDQRRIIQDYRLTVAAGGRGIGSHASLTAKDIKILSDQSWRRNVFPWRKRQELTAWSRCLSLMSIFCVGKSVAITEKRNFCLVPSCAIATDSIAVLRGFPTPFLLRLDRNSGSGYRLLGSVYMHGFMNGECGEIHADIHLH